MIGFAALAPAAIADPVPLDALGAVGDQEVVLPSYSSIDRSTPGATALDVGDVNGDGLDDVGMVLPSFEPAYPSSAWISFSPSELPTTLSAGDDPWQGMHIVGSPLTDGVLTGIGDVNGDGLGEVVVATYSRYVVVFGRTDGATVDIDHLGDAGFTIDDISTGVQSGAGSTSFGVAFINQSVMSAGDQNGDSRPDLAFRNGQDIEVAYTPASPAGAHVDGSNLGDAGFTLAAPRWAPPGPYVARIGDINDDSRPDLAVFWQDSVADVAHATGVTSPSSGATVDLTTVAQDDLGFDLSAPGAELEDGLAVGDQNSDGVTDLGLGAVTGGQRTFTVAYSPGIGTSRTLQPTEPSDGIDTDLNGWAVDVGDQDGDGRDDIGDYYCVRFSSADFSQNGRGCGITSIDHGVLVVGSVADRNGDGKAELLVVYANPYSDEVGSYEATWREQVYLSTPAPTPEVVAPPSESDGDLLFAGRFITNPAGGTRTLAGRGSAVVRGLGGNLRALSASRIVDANSMSTRTRVIVDPSHSNLVKGEPYQYQLHFKTSRGLAAVSPTRWFVYGGASTLHQVKGTPRADHLQGSAVADIVLAGRGNDVIGGRDGIRDYVSCGPGTDRAYADRVDRVYGCEDVRR